VQSTSFVPNVLNVVPGDWIEFHFMSGDPHNVTSGTPCTPDGLYFDSIVDGSNPLFVWLVPEGAPDEIPFFCTPHCALGMTGVINIDQQGQQSATMDIGFADIVNTTEVMYTQNAGLQNMQINAFGLNPGSSFRLGVSIEGGDFDVDLSVSRLANATVELYEAATGITVDIDEGDSTITLLDGHKYMFVGDTHDPKSYFSFGMQWENMDDDGDEEVGFTSLSLVNGADLHAVMDEIRIHVDNPNESAELTLTGPGEVLISAAGNVTSSDLTLPTGGEEAIVTVPAGDNSISIAPNGLLILNMDTNDGGGSDCMSEDVNCDGVVDVVDLLAVIAVWGATSP
jgi:hypothetical protein